MKQFIVIAAALGGFLLIEFQSGSAATPDLPAIFNQTREIRPYASEPSAKPLRVMTWNIERGGAIDRVSQEMQTNPADLVLLQEVDWDAHRTGQRDITGDLAKALHLNASYGIEFEELSQEHGRPAYTGQATLTRLPVRASRLLRFTHQSGFWQPRGWVPSSVPLLQRRVGSRIALVTEVKFDGKLLVVYNAHLESRSAGPIQAEQLDEIFADSRRYPPHTAFLLGGDLNTKYLPSIFLHKLEREGYQSASGERIERTHTMVMALDWLFAKGPVQLNEGVVRRDLKGSDHYPIYARLRSK